MNQWSDVDRLFQVASTYSKIPLLSEQAILRFNYLSEIVAKNRSLIRPHMEARALQPPSHPFSVVFLFYTGSLFVFSCAIHYTTSKVSIFSSCGMQSSLHRSLSRSKVSETEERVPHYIAEIKNLNLTPIKARAAAFQQNKPVEQSNPPPRSSTPTQPDRQFVSHVSPSPFAILQTLTY